MASTPPQQLRTELNTDARPPRREDVRQDHTVGPDPEVRDLIAARRRGHHCPALSTHEAARLVFGSLAYRGQTGEELERVLGWAAQARVDGYLLELALNGEICAVWEGEEVLFALPERPIEMAEVDQ